jgi:hypothetical protein
MMRSVVGTVATAVAVLVTAAVLLVGGLAWRLSRGPIDLPSLTPRLQAALSSPDGSAVVRIASTALEWDPSHRDLDVRARDVQVSGADGRVLGTLPVLAIGISPAALLRGAVMPRSLQAIAPRVELARERDGHIDVGIGGAPAPAVTDLLSGLLGASRTAAGSTVPKRIRVRDGDVSMVDRATGTTWHATNVTLSLRRESDGIAVERLVFDLAPVKVAADGRVGERGRFDLHTTVSGLRTEGLMPYWPATVAPALRHWITTNVSGGRIRALRATLAGSLNGTSAPGFTLSSIDGKVRFDGQTVRWLEGMPPATAVAGTAVLSTDGRWQLRVARGEIEGIEIVRTAVSPQPAGSGAPGVRVDAVVRGPLSRAFALLEKLSSHGAANLPFGAGEISGGLTARVETVVPMEPGADRTPLAVRADGDLRSVAMRRAFRGRTITAPRLQFDLDGRQMVVTGGVRVGRAAAELRWRQVVAGASRGRRAIVLKGRLDAEGRHALGFDLAPWLDGPVDFQARLAPHGQETSDFDLQLNLDHASLDLPLLNMVKAPGAPATSQARLALAAGQVRSVDDFRLQANGSSLGGQATFGPDESWRTVEGQAEIAPRNESDHPGHVTFTARPAGTESQLTLTSDDAGDVLRTIDAYADATEGRLKFTGTGRIGVPGFPLAGTVKVERFTLTRSPMIAKIAALGSISPIVDALRGDGIPFSQLTASLTHRAGVIVIGEGTMTGAAVAMALRGTVDRMKDDLSLTGTLVPSYTALARLTKDVPALGPTSTDVRSDSARGVDFEVSGSLGDPYVTVKPASAAPSGSRREGGRSSRSRSRSELRPEAEQKPKAKPKPRRRPRPGSPAPQEPEAE